ncbi:MAG TPA: hypothetical protein VFN49_00980 [Candidatus Aquilonibacter sp.]|nr:hypothetical protein [Candidatus Aquilonibacter sp.]
MKIPTDDVNDTFYATPRTTAGESLRFYTDSGGATIIFAGVTPGGTLPALSCDAFIPLPAAPGFRVAPDTMRKQLLVDDPAQSGVLGALWLDGRTWTWDYPGRALYWRANGDVPRVPQDHTVALGFQKQDGKHTTGFPRVTAQIDGVSYDFLLDTGAMSLVSGQLRASSFITASIAARWHAMHPDWPYRKGAEGRSHADMIRVDNVRIGGFDSGPAWFAVRPDANFTHFMSQWMDKPVVGSIGGSALHDLRMTVDYTAEKAYFERP